jgi:hypothetical protein
VYLKHLIRKLVCKQDWLYRCWILSQDLIIRLNYLSFDMQCLGFFYVICVLCIFSDLFFLLSNFLILVYIFWAYVWDSMIGHMSDLDIFWSIVLFPLSRWNCFHRQYWIQV